MNKHDGRGLPDEVIAEIATHLEDCYEELRLQGLEEAAAIERVFGSLTNWHDLDRSLRKSRQPWRTINRRTEQLWLPALATLVATNLLLMAFTRASIAWFPRTGPVGIYAPWLATQPLIGALGAHLSRRAGGLRTARLIASLFPSIVLLGLGVFLVPVTAFLERNVWATAHPVLLVVNGLACLTPIGIALLCGALPFLELSSLDGILPRATQP